jgi:D-alanyl-D-alanine carboxypeptidase (penicillin-binding protein 5/6)
VRLPFRQLTYVLLVAILAIGTIGAFARPASAADSPSLPDVTAEAVYSVDIDAGVELYAKNEREQLPPASTTKIATAFLLVRNVEDLDQTVTIEEQDMNGEGESTMALQPGDVVTYQDLLYGLLLPSGNDAANAVARLVGGQLLAAEGKEGGDPIERFVQEMNNLAAEFKLEQTHFLNPTGLHQDGHVTSARDLGILARRAFTQRVIRDVIAEPSYIVNYQGPNAREATIETTVTMKKEGAEDVIGGKTGTTPEAGACLVLETQERGGNRVITVLLGSAIEFYDDGTRNDASDRRFDDMRAILDQMESDYRWVDISSDKEMPGLNTELTVWQVALEDDDSIVVPRHNDDSISYLLQLGPEAAPDSEVGRVLFFVGADQVAERSVVQIASGGES